MVNPNDVITDGTVEWTVRDLRGGTDGNPVGTILAFAGNGAIPDGYLLCDGADVSRTDYADLFAAIDTIYGDGDGSTTFNLPNLIGRVLQGDSVGGTYKAPGLPNITGTISGNALTTSFLAASNVFETHSWSNLQGGSSYGSGWRGFSFDASRSNTIYGASNTVQPPAVTVKYIIKY